jgi:hypothetical protein
MAPIFASVIEQSKQSKNVSRNDLIMPQDKPGGKNASGRLGVAAHEDFLQSAQRNLFFLVSASSGIMT